jgi:dihydropyrimidinase
MDLIIKGNCVVTPYAIGPAEIGIAGEKIVAIAAPGGLTAPAGVRVVDAGDSIVMPGGCSLTHHSRHPG